jgi:hypothetical protein
LGAFQVERVYNEQWRAEWIPVERGFTVLPRRWVVERTFAWIGRYRRLSKDYEYLSNAIKTMICLSMTKTDVKPLCKNYLNFTTPSYGRFFSLVFLFAREDYFKSKWTDYASLFD